MAASSNFFILHLRTRVSLGAEILGRRKRSDDLQCSKRSLIFIKFAVTGKHGSMPKMHLVDRRLSTPNGALADEI